MLGGNWNAEEAKRSGMNMLICSSCESKSRVNFILNCIKHTKVLKEVTDRFKREIQVFTFPEAATELDTISSNYKGLHRCNTGKIFSSLGCCVALFPGYTGMKSWMHYRFLGSTT